MRASVLLPIALVCGLVGFVAIQACNSGNGDCPAKASVTPAGSCDDDHLQCAFDLTSPNAACDGTTSVIATSCTCTNGSWDCPAPIECEAGAADGGDEGSTEAGQDDASAADETGSQDDGASDASIDAPTDAPDAG